MKSVMLVFFAAFLLLYVGCGGEEEAGVSLRLTNPQGLSVPFYGSYMISSATDSVIMDDYTDIEYNFTLSSGESAEGWVRKDTVDVVDTLHFQAFVNGEEEVSLKTTLIIELIQFSVSAQ
ncbi:MAG: hypothetical protein OEV79_08630 [candidate division WOR-3 bacterium]|nr:hypothetical protein [candidate division WOR-3 bacterium]